MFWAFPFLVCPLPPASVLLPLVTQGGQPPHVLRFQALMFAPPSVSSCCKGSRGQRLTPGADTLLLPLNNTSTSCPIPRTGMGVPLSCSPHSYPHRAIYPHEICH